MTTKHTRAYVVDWEHLTRWDLISARAAALVAELPELGRINRRQIARFCARTRFASRPKWRMRMKPRGTACMRKRRRNSVPSSVMAPAEGRLGIDNPVVLHG